jgi:tetratricopeptide (TPR) repeat protein/NAD-dependent dihydropyrimidine dehydrogenase PreA subunit
MASESSAHATRQALPRTIALDVLAKPRSSMGRRRALVLIAVHLVVAAHIIQWLVVGLTISPVEPSESMYTLERGWMNAGFILFAGAIAATLVLGRWFCGWACHVVALQDACSWLMKRMGVRPRPLRAPMLRWAPMVLAIYMFAWPTLRREAIRPIAMWLGVWDALRPWIGDAPARVFGDWSTTSAFFRSHIIVRDFWATFPAWYVAIPFLLVCGFACVYLLGSKGFCTYGCPYGALFGAADRLAPGRIRVTDACKHCGHCTSVCTSNVRVHEEVRDFGMVVDPGCMKCLDCVSACPSDALYFGFGTPSAIAKPRVDDAPPRFLSRARDWTRRSEVAYGVLFLVLFTGFRGLLGQVPILMAMGLAACATLLCWKCVGIVQSENVRLQNLQLRLKGRVKPLGIVTISASVLLIGVGTWGAASHAMVLAGSAFAARIDATPDRVFAPGYAPDPRDQKQATRALRMLTLSSVPKYGGSGDRFGEEHLATLAWLAAVAGDAAACDRWFEKAIEAGASSGDDVSQSTLNGFATARIAHGADAGAIIESLRQIARNCPSSARVRLMLAQAIAQTGDHKEAKSWAEDAVDRRPHDPTIVSGSAGLMLSIGRVDRAKELVRQLLREHPEDGTAHRALAAILAQQGRGEEAATEAKRAIELEPWNQEHRRFASELLRALGRNAEAAQIDAMEAKSDRVPEKH